MKSRLGGHVEPLTQCSMMLARGRNLEVISQSQVIDSFLPIHNDLQLTAQAMYFAELIDAFTSERIENYPVYKLLADTLCHLPSAQNSELLFRYFEIQLLGYLGYRPQLHECIDCRMQLEHVDNFFSSSGGGILCPGCSHNELVVRVISVDALKVLRLLQRDEYSIAVRLRINKSLARELGETPQGYIQYLLERKLKSTGFLSVLRNSMPTESLFDPQGG